MSRSRLLPRIACLGAVFLAGSFLIAQTPQSQPIITKDSTPSSQDLQAWTVSKDPRLLAWAAYFAGERGDTVILDLLTQSLSAMPAVRYGAAAFGPDHDAALVVLDTLIRQHQHVPVQTISEVSQNFPQQALLLAFQLPRVESINLYTRWYNLSNGDYSNRLLARISTLLLGDHPPPFLVATVLYQAEEHLVITLQAPPGSAVGEVGLGGTCGDGLGGGSPSGWPYIASYSFEENNNGSSDPVLVSWPGERITYIRRSAYSGFGSCFGVDFMNARTRHALIAHWLGLQANEMPWQTESNVSILWTSRDQYLLDLGKQVDSARQTLQATVQRLVDRKLLSPNAAASTQPRLVVTVLCAIDPCPISGTQTTPRSPAN